MGTLAFTNTFAGLPNLVASQLDQNFTDLRTFVNGGGSTFIDSTNLQSTVRFQLSQLKEPRSLAIMTAHFIQPDALSVVRRTRAFAALEPIELIGVRLTILKQTAGSASKVTLHVSVTDDQLAYITEQGHARMTYDDTIQDNWGDMRPPLPSTKMRATTGQYFRIEVAPTADIVNISHLVVQLKVAAFHTVT